MEEERKVEDVVMKETTETKDVSEELSEDLDMLEVLEPEVTEETAVDTPIDESLDALPIGAMAEGEVRFGIVATSPPLGNGHWLCDHSTCGDLIAALPATLLVKGRTPEAGGVAVDMAAFLDDVVAGAGRLEGIKGIVEETGLPQWAVSRIIGTFPAIKIAYNEAIDITMLEVEAAAIKAATGITIKQKRTRTKKQLDHKGGVVSKEEAEENFEKYFPPDTGISKFLLASRMKDRYKEETGVQQAVQINIIGPEADL